jgi:hypothetical protein
MEMMLPTSGHCEFRAGRGAMSRALLRVRAIAALAFVLCGCAQGTRPFLIVQVCVQNKDGIAQLIGELMSVAESRKMKFVDNSAVTRRDLANVGYASRERADGSPVINIDVERDDGMGVGALNVGLPGYQVALGFSEGSDKLEARRFADEVIKRLEQHWRVETVPPGSGAMPKPDCR